MIETKFGKSETRYFSGAGRESSENGKNREEYYESAKEMQRANGYMDQRATGR